MSESEITFQDIRDCNTTVEVNALALLRAYHDEVFDNRGNAHQRFAKNRLKDAARSLDPEDQ